MPRASTDPASVVWRALEWFDFFISRELELSEPKRASHMPFRMSRKSGRSRSPMWRNRYDFVHPARLSYHETLRRSFLCALSNGLRAFARTPNKTLSFTQRREENRKAQRRADPPVKGAN